MQSICSIYKIGPGPSSSHTMGPARAAQIFRKRIRSDGTRIQVELQGSLARTGKGHLTDRALEGILGRDRCDIFFNAAAEGLGHPNTLIFREVAPAGDVLQTWEVFSVGGGELREPTTSGTIRDADDDIYDFSTFAGLREQCRLRHTSIWDLAKKYEAEGFETRLAVAWQVMRQCVLRGLQTDTELLPGDLGVMRKARKFHAFASKAVGLPRDMALIFSYALAVAEENAAGGTVVTAPTCGSAGVLPAILLYHYRHRDCPESQILQALTVAGMVGLLVRTNASVSGAEVGCQGEIGTACAMAAAGDVVLRGGGIDEIEYAAEMAMEHFLGLTCDPVLGLVQIPCIERNALAATRALDCATYALATDLGHKIRFDDVVKVMYATGMDMQQGYKETAMRGLASLYVAT